MSRRDPDQTPELHQLAYLNVEEPWLYSEPLVDVQASHLISKAKPATLRKKLISPAYIRDLFLSVTNQSS